jgi:hypothetical protein
MSSLIKILKTLFTAEKKGPYYHVVLAKWGKYHNVQQLRRELQKDFTFVKTLVREIPAVTVISELKGTVPELLFQADTLSATITPTKATLFQKTSAPFTPRDLALRQQILTWYPNTFTIFLTEREPQYTSIPQRLP